MYKFREFLINRVMLLHYMRHTSICGKNKLLTKLVNGFCGIINVCTGLCLKKFKRINNLSCSAKYWLQTGRSRKSQKSNHLFLSELVSPERNKRPAYLRKSTKILALFFLCIATTHADSSREYQLKAAYMLNFARFIYWPDSAFEKDSNNFNICVLGENPFGDNLIHLSDKKIQNRNIKISYEKKIIKKQNCNIVFISKSENKKYLNTLRYLSGKTILTVSDIDDFTASGGMIGFVRIKNKIKFEINVGESSKSGIKYRSQLLEVAEELR